MREKHIVDDEIARILFDKSNQVENTSDNSPDNEIETIHLYIYKEEPKKNSNRTEILAVPNPTSDEISSFKIRPVTFSQTITSPASGRGHQDAAYAKGTITFYNGSSTSQTIPQGTQLTGFDGVNVVTDNLVIIPASSPTTPPTFGEASVDAHAIFTGPGGNIKAEDINSYSLSPSILAQNIYAFRGGMDARDFSVVTSTDIDNALNPLKKAAMKSIQTQLHPEVKTGESLFPPNCKISIDSNHKAGEEAANVKVTYIKTCTRIKYIDASLYQRGLDIISAIAEKKLGTKFSPLLKVHVHVLKATLKKGTQDTGVIAVSISGVWFYKFSASELKKIKQIAAGEPVDEVLKGIRKIPGVMEAKITYQGFGNNYYLPKNAVYIRTLVVL